MNIKLSKEEDLKILQDLGYKIYDDLRKAKSKVRESESLDWLTSTCQNFMFSTLLTEIQEPNDLKRIIEKCDYMGRCTNTNAKCIIVTAYLYGEYLTRYEKINFRDRTKEMLDYYTERKIHPEYNRVLMLKDIVDLIHGVSERFLGEDFHNAIQDYIASMIYYYNF